MEKMVYKAIIRYLTKHYPGEKKQIIKLAKKILHAKLIRTHTVAGGADSCDYWYVPDKSSTAKSYTGPIV